LWLCFCGMQVVFGGVVLTAVVVIMAVVGEYDAVLNYYKMVVMRQIPVG